MHVLLLLQMVCRELLMVQREWVLRHPMHRAYPWLLVLQLLLQRGLLLRIGEQLRGVLQHGLLQRLKVRRQKWGLLLHLRRYQLLGMLCLR